VPYLYMSNTVYNDLRLNCNDSELHVHAVRRWSAGRIEVYLRACAY